MDRHSPVPAPRPQRIAVVMDYQNIHLTAHDLFSEPDERVHETLIHPLNFGQTVVRERNSNLRPGYAPGTLSKVLCYRGQPNARFDPDMHRRTDAQRSAWSRSSPSVQVVYRPLRYVTRKTGYSTENGTTYEVESATEKGIDVLCAMAVLTQSMREDIDVVILASHDTDLAPCLDTAMDLGQAKIETVQWWNPDRGIVGHLRPTSGKSLWNTRLDHSAYDSSRDRVIY